MEVRAPKVKFKAIKSKSMFWIAGDILAPISRSSAEFVETNIQTVSMEYVLSFETTLSHSISTQSLRLVLLSFERIYSRRCKSKYIGARSMKLFVIARKPGGSRAKSLILGCEVIFTPKIIQFLRNKINSGRHKLWLAFKFDHSPRLGDRSMYTK